MILNKKLYRYKYGYRVRFVKYLTIILSFIAISISYVSAQNISVIADNRPIKDVFQQIEAQTDYTFAFSNSDFNANRRVSIVANNQSLGFVLEKILRDANYTYAITKRHILLITNSKIDKTKEKKIASLPSESDTEYYAEDSTEANEPESVILQPIIELHNEKVKLNETEIDEKIKDISQFQKNTDDIGYETEINNPTINSKLPSFVLKTNLLMDLTTSFSLGTELKLSDFLTLDISVGYNPWTFSDNKKFKYLSVQPELRYWIYEPFNGHFLGANLLYSYYNVGGVSLPFGLMSDLKDYRYQGSAYSIGFSYGYQWILSPRWNLEANIGLGYMYLNNTKYECQTCGKKIEDQSKNYFGLTKLGLSLIYII